MRGWLVAPVIGTGTEGDPYRPSVADRQGVEGDRLEFVIDVDKSDVALVGFDVVDPSDMEAMGGEIIVLDDELNELA